MTIRQKILKVIYPFLMGWNRFIGRKGGVIKRDKGSPPQSIYNLSIELNNGDTVPLSVYKGKKMMIVNTASNCGFTNQYEDLQKLYLESQPGLVILAFPANDFKEQEKGSDEDIAQFCKINYGVTFPLVKKSSVVKGAHQHEVFRWLTEKSRNGWNDRPPSWNFSKYIVSESGELTHYFNPSVSPLNSTVLEAVH